MTEQLQKQLLDFAANPVAGGVTWQGPIEFGHYPTLIHQLWPGSILRVYMHSNGCWGFDCPSVNLCDNVFARDCGPAAACEAALSLCRARVAELAAALGMATMMV